MKRITESQLRNMIRQCVYESIDECGIEEIDKNSLNKAGKYAAIGALGATLFKGCEELSNLERNMLDNEEAGLEMMYNADHEFELDKARTAHPFDESKVRRMVENIVRTSLKKRLSEMTNQDFEDDFNEKLRDTKHDKALSNKQFDAEFDKSLTNSNHQKHERDNSLKKFNFESIIRKAVKNALSESTLYTDDIDSSDLRVNVEPYTEDGYCEWEATCDNGWYTFRGWYSKGRCELEDVISGHSGHGMQHGVDDELRDWFYDNLEDRVISEIEAQA